MDKAKAAAIIQELFDRQARESFGDVKMPPNTGLDLVVATWRSAGDMLTRRHVNRPEPFTLAVMALMYGAVTPAFSTNAGRQAYFIRALFQLTRHVDTLDLPKVDREIIDATLSAASDLAPQWFPRKDPKPQ